MAAHQAPPSLGFSRQGYWSGLPFSSPIHESESEVTQSCPSLRNPMDCSLPGSSIHGIFQAKSTGVGCHCLLPRMLLLLLSCFSRVRLRATPEMAAHQAPPSLGFSRQEHWSGLPFPSPITYYYLAKKDPIFEANFIYLFFIIKKNIVFLRV